MAPIPHGIAVPVLLVAGTHDGPAGRDRKKNLVPPSPASQKVQSGQTRINAARAASEREYSTGFFTKLLKTGAKKFLRSARVM
jgi:hypothetical protein